MAAVSIGIAVGVAVFYATIRILSDILYGIRPTDPLNAALCIGLVLGAGLTAACSASRKALRLDPAQLLRLE